MNARQVARGLGWFSLGLGAVEVLAPGQMSRLVGAPEKQGSGLVRAYGARELLAGAGLLTQPAAAATWMWARVAGDVLDLAAVGRVQPEDPHGRKRLVRSLLMLTGVMVVDVLVARALAHEKPPTLTERVAARLTGKERF
ncbi:hypothetical protein [Deinococcus budaensis]|uniref:Uncharacterized protein n=1 Tax=Deinococcus budaensis TaxID=1665626 RepID=A0A7W8GH25_9DEIO|nr:hypothetical protein [Deinococcus budaensis]MBB5235103.1 hypothetical protein [Deinococcus budaensis]